MGPGEKHDLIGPGEKRTMKNYSTFTQMADKMWEASDGAS